MRLGAAKSWLGSIVHLNASVAGLYDKIDEEPARPSVVASGAAEPCEMVVLVATAHELGVGGNEIWAGDPFLCALVDPLDLPRVVTAREKDYAPIIYPNHSTEVSTALEVIQPSLWQTAHD